MLLYCCTHYFIIALVQFVLHALFKHHISLLLYFFTLLHCTVSVHNVLPHWIHEGLSVTFLIVWYGVYSCLLLWKYRKQTTSMSIFEFYLLILFHFINDGQLLVGYLKMYYFDLFPVLFPVLTWSTRKAKMLGLKREKAISTKKKTSFNLMYIRLYYMCIYHSYTTLTLELLPEKKIAKSTSVTSVSFHNFWRKFIIFQA